MGETKADLKSVSIVMPLLNEGTLLEGCLEKVFELNPRPCEIIAVDGGSSDNTLEILSRYPEVKLLKVNVQNRSFQMHEGAKISKGDVLCFLHGDTYLVPSSVSIMRRILNDNSIAMAGFTSFMIGEKGTQRLTTFHNFLKTYYAAFLFRPYKFLFKGGRLLFGDQAIFCNREAYFKSGGFDVNMPIMEEANLCDRICQYGKIKQIPFPVYSSDRRVAKWGVLKANLIYLYVGFMWGIGYSPHKLKKLFTDIR